MWNFHESAGGEDEAKDSGARGQQRGRIVLIWIEQRFVHGGSGACQLFRSSSN
jgi:hypothetical protein